MVVKIEFCLVFGGDGVVVTSITGGDDMQLSVEISDVLSKTKPQMGKPKAESKKKHGKKGRHVLGPLSGGTTGAALLGHGLVSPSMASAAGLRQ